MPGISIFHNLISSFATKSSSNLARLRNATGHPFSLCRKALAACDGEYSQALAWLQQEAAKHGLTKAEKLKCRPMSQGLLGMIATSKCVAIVEVNCETDFVARNQDFQSLVASSTESLFKSLFSESREPGTHQFYEEALKSIPYLGSSSKSISDALAATIASIGENMCIPRGIGMTLSSGTGQLIAYCHSSNAGAKKDIRDVHMGKYAAALHYRHVSNMPTSEWQAQASLVSHQLCQHIVGMNPLPGLVLDEIPSAKNPDEEKCLLRQPFIFDESITVGVLLDQNEIHLENFVRVECGVEAE